MLSLSALVCVTVLATTSSPEGARAPLLVLEPSGDAIDADVRAALGARIAATLSDAGVPGVIGQSELRSLLDAEARRQSVGCDDASCAAEIAGALGAERVVVGTVTRLGGTYALQLTLLDVKNGRALARSESSGPSVNALFDGARASARAIAGEAGTEAAPFALHRVLWPASCITVALAVAASGFAYDAMATSSRNA